MGFAGVGFGLGLITAAGICAGLNEGLGGAGTTTAAFGVGVGLGFGFVTSGVGLGVGVGGGELGGGGSVQMSTGAVDVGDGLAGRVPRAGRSARS